MSAIYPYCLCTTVGHKALTSLLETSGAGSYRTDDPWIVAAEMFSSATSAEQRLPILFAVGEPLQFSHWGVVQSLDVVELHRGKYESICSFTQLEPVNPIWSSVDSVFLKPSQEQLQREVLEGLRQHRYPLVPAELHPYAICETPAFLLDPV